MKFEPYYTTYKVSLTKKQFKRLQTLNEIRYEDGLEMDTWDCIEGCSFEGICGSMNLGYFALFSIYSVYDTPETKAKIVDKILEVVELPYNRWG